MPVQFAIIRNDLDPKFKAAHDKLATAFYGQKEYGEYGILDKETFQKLHSLLWQKYVVAFHETNMALEAKGRIPEDKYRYEYDDIGIVTKDRVNIAQAAVASADVDIKVI